MSHVAYVECKISDLDALEEACKKLKATLKRGQRQFQYYAGSKSPCIHAIVLDGKTDGYEVGLVQREANTPNEFRFACDFYSGSLTKAFGQNLEGLQNEYLATVAENQLANRGWSVRREVEGQQIHLYAQQ